jgi:S1-C subfamily serine protease
LRLWLVATCWLLASAAWPQNPEPSAAPTPPVATASNWGTGFVVGEGFVVTALHVIQGRNSVLLGPLASGRWVPAEVVQTDPRLDLALLKARIDLPALSLAPSAEVPMGLEVSVIGFPQPRFQGMGKKITQGIVNGYRSERQQAQDIGLLQISAEVSRGSSGGPVLAPDGLVIGMVLRKINAQKVAEQTEDLVVNVNYALRSSQIIKFLQASPASPRVQGLSLSTVLRPYQIFEQTQASVLAVIGRSVANPVNPP